MTWYQPESKEDKLLLASLEDKYRQCENKYYPVNSDFLDMTQQSLAENNFRMRTSAYCFHGGYVEAERKVMIFLPDYIDPEAARNDFYSVITPEDDPLVLLRVIPTARDATLTHRDYLGALMNLGIKRSKIGDIVVYNNYSDAGNANAGNVTGADIIVLREIADYLSLNYQRVGRCSVNTEILPVTELRWKEPDIREKQINVASMRLDTVAAGVYGCSRSKAVAAIEAGLLFFNGRQILKADYILDAGDTLVWRSKGRVDIVETGNTTHKGRIWLTIRFYI